jgi:hypothetical protein
LPGNFSQFAFIILSCLLLTGLAAPAPAASVGAFIQVEGPVEVLRQGKPPAQAVKVQDGVDQGDLVRTKSGARAHIRFVDDTVLTIAPGSALVIEEFLYDGPRGKRQAGLNLLRGLTYGVVNRVHQTTEPDFVIKTHTAVFGVRGTRFFTLVGVKFSGGYNEQGMLQAATRDGSQKVLLMGSEFAVAATGRPLSPPQRLSAADLGLLRQWLVTGVPAPVITGDPPFMSLLGPPGQKMPILGVPKELRDGMFVPPTPKPERHHQYE